MKQFWLVAAAALLVTTLLPGGAFAQRGGFRGGAIGGGFRGAAIGGGFRGAAIGRGCRGSDRASVQQRLAAASVVLGLASLASARASVQPRLVPVSVVPASLPSAAPVGRQDGVGAEDGAGRLPLVSALARRGATLTTRRTTLILASFGRTATPY